MGYTHHFSELVADEALAEDTRTIIEAAERLGIAVRGGDGTGEPIVTPQLIALNGDAEEGLDHETFYLSDRPRPFGCMNFCKTVRKPYDAVVVAILIDAVVTERQGWESIGSDGTWQDWSTPQNEGLPSGLALYEEAFGRLGKRDEKRIRRLLGDEG